jgi:FkbM family methyltransferase
VSDAGALGRVRAALGGLKLGHRLGAFRSAVSLVQRPVPFVAREALFYPARPLAGAVARLVGADPAAAWRALTRRGLNVSAYTLRASGRRVAVRHGTPDVYLLHETLGRAVYEPPAPVAAVLAGIGRPLRVVDLGANIGLFEVFLADRAPVGRIVAYEPDPDNLALLRRNAAESGSGARWEVVPAAAWTRDGTLAFMAGRFAESRVPQEAGAPTVQVPARDVFRDLADVDLLKIDIEGGEWPILADPRFPEVPARALVIEYHRWGAPGPDPERLVRDTLTAAGYSVGPASEDAPGFGVLWAWRAA